MELKILKLYEQTLEKASKKINTNEDEGAVGVANVALSTSRLGSKPVRRKKKMTKDREVIEENEQYSNYTEGDFNIFEIKDKTAEMTYHTGLKRQSPQYWRQNDTTQIMLNAMNRAKNRNFVVRTSMGDSIPMRHTGL